jgi:hypothetical protein
MRLDGSQNWSGGHEEIKQILTLVLMVVIAINCETQHKYNKLRNSITAITVGLLRHATACVLGAFRRRSLDLVGANKHLFKVCSECSNNVLRTKEAAIGKIFMFRHNYDSKSFLSNMNSSPVWTA